MFAVGVVSGRVEAVMSAPGTVEAPVFGVTADPQAFDLMIDGVPCSERLGVMLHAIAQKVVMNIACGAPPMGSIAGALAEASLLAAMLERGE